MTVLETTYLTLKKCELTDSQYDFSANWCGMSRSYLSWLKATKTSASIEALTKLLFKLRAEEKRLRANPGCIFPEVQEFDAGQLRSLISGLERELERICLTNSLVDSG